MENPNIKGGYCVVEPERIPTGIIAAKAWGTSRPADLSSGIEQIINIDVPVNEMEDFILKIRAPIIVREMLFSLRDHVGWAQTSRVENLDEWEVYNGYEDHPEVLLCYDQMQARKVSQSQDNFREMLPMVYMTTFTVKLSARTLVRFRDSVRQLVQEWFYSDAPTRFARVVPMMADFESRLTKVIDSTVYGQLKAGVYGYVELFPKLGEPEVRNYATIFGDFVYVHLRAVPITLRAQIVRHRPITFTDTMSTYLTPQGVTAPIASKIALSMVMPRAMALSMLAKRNCWIAQEDLWLPVISALNTAFGATEGMLPLPCDKGFCPVARDNDLRKEGKDPAPACPIWNEMNHKGYTIAERKQMQDYADKRTLSRHFWHDKISSMIPF